jgi:DivIVA domain-containing protein
MVRRISSRQLAVVCFRRGLRGYRINEVQALLRRMQRTAQRAEAGEIPRLTAADVDGAEFGLRPFGYRIDEVDDLLDRVAETLRPLGPIVSVPSPPKGFLMTATRARRLRFKKRGSGYVKADVDRWVDEIAAELDRLESGLPPTRPTEEELNLLTFDYERRGYDEGQVDRFLDQAAATLARRRATGWRSARSSG